jgi:copper resistance protein C
MGRFLGLAIALAGLVAASEASAHAFLERASPPVGSVVSRAPAEVRLWFSERIEPRFSRARLITSDGAAIAAPSAVVNGNQLVLRVPRLRPGTYRVMWSVVSVDTHKTGGAFPFEVRP